MCLITPTVTSKPLKRLPDLVFEPIAVDENNGTPWESDSGVPPAVDVDAATLRRRDRCTTGLERDRTPRRVHGAANRWKK